MTFAFSPPAHPSPLSPSTPAPETSLPLRVVITGGLGALGRSVGAELCTRGAQVALLDLAPTIAVPHATWVAGGVDLADETTTANAMQEAAQRMGGIDALVNVAGGFIWETILDGDIATWDRLYAMNLRSAVVACRQALPYLLAQGDGRASIVNVGALASQRAEAGMGAYSASKAGVSRLTEALAEELKERGIRVNAVLPAILDTPANRLAMPAADTATWMPPASLAAVIAFLLSFQARALNGCCLPATGRG